MMIISKLINSYLLNKQNNKKVIIKKIFKMYLMKQIYLLDKLNFKLYFLVIKCIKNSKINKYFFVFNIISFLLQKFKSFHMFL